MYNKTETQARVKESYKSGASSAARRAAEVRSHRKGTRMSEMTRVISFTSGKGGVGKTHTVVNTALALARRGKSVLVLDGDLGLANINVLLGLRSYGTIADVLSGKMRFSDILLDGPEGISIIPGASGIQSACHLSPDQQLLLLQNVEEIASQYDYLLIDTQAGIGPEVMYFNSASSEVICVITSEPTSLTDAYALIKILSQNYGEKSVSILVNNVRTDADAERAYSRLARSVNRFLSIELNYMGCVPSDASVQEAVSEQRPVLELYPSSKAGLAIARFAEQLDQTVSRPRIKGGMQFFFQQLIERGAAGE